MSGKMTVGIDVGTTAVKAGILDSNGVLTQYFSQTYPTLRPKKDWVEQDGTQWVDAIKSALGQFAPHMPDIAAIGICSQVNTHIFVGADGRPLDTAIVWQDGRASAEAAELDAQISEAQRIAWWGAPMPIDASHALSRMLWVQRNRPEVWEKTRWVMLPKDYCMLALTGVAVTDPLSNIGLVDLNLKYIPEVLDLVPGAAEKLAPIQGVNALVGDIMSGPAKGIPIANCSMDGWTGLLGCGGAIDKATSYLSGTSEIVGINSKSIRPTPGVIVFAECEGTRFHLGPTQAGGAAKLWFSELSEKSPEEMSALAGSSDYSKTAPIFVPHLQGERAPIWITHTRAVFLGMDQSTSLADLSRSVYEGVAFSVRMLLEELEASANVRNDVIVCGGGGFRSEVWNQIRANVLGRTLKRIAVTDPGVLGAAGIAAYAAGHHASLSETFGNLISFDQTYEPQIEYVERYDRQFEIYKNIIQACAPLNRELLEIG